MFEMILCECYGSFQVNFIYDFSTSMSISRIEYKKRERRSIFVVSLRVEMFLVNMH